MDWRELVQSGNVRVQLPDLHHLPHFLIADEDLVDLEDRLLEHEVDGVLEDLLRIRFDHVLPYLLVDGELHPLARVLIEALEIPAIDIDSLPICRPQKQEGLDFACDILPLHDLLCLLLPILEIGVHIRSHNIIGRIEKQILLPDLAILRNLENILLEDEDLRIPHHQRLLDLDR